MKKFLAVLTLAVTLVATAFTSSALARTGHPSSPARPMAAAAKGRNVGTASGNQYYCDYGTGHIVCLFYDKGQQGAYFGFANSSNSSRCHIPNFKGYTFNGFVPPGYADGQGAPVLNDAASIADTSNNPGDIYYGQNYTGNYDYLYAHTYGDLSSYTDNNNGSGYFYC